MKRPLKGDSNTSQTLSPAALLTSTLPSGTIPPVFYHHRIVSMESSVALLCWHNVDGVNGRGATLIFIVLVPIETPLYESLEEGVWELHVLVTSEIEFGIAGPRRGLKVAPMSASCLVPGLAALWGARVGRGVVVAGRLHTWSFTLELFSRWRQRLVYRTQHVRRLGLEGAREDRSWRTRSTQQKHRNAMQKPTEPLHIKPTEPFHIKPMEPFHINLFHSTEDAGVLKPLPFPLNGLLTQTTSINMGMFGIPAFNTSSSLERKYTFSFIS